MSPELFALLERIHGHIAVLGLAVLLHPVITLWTRKGLNWRMVLTAELGALLLLVPYAIGWSIYPVYRSTVKPRLYQMNPGAMYAFETKEHLAAMAVLLAIGGAVTLRATGKTDAGRRAAWWLLAGAWLLGAGAGILGLWVASASAPAW